MFVDYLGADAVIGFRNSMNVDYATYITGYVIADIISSFRENELSELRAGIYGDENVNAYGENIQESSGEDNELAEDSRIEDQESAFEDEDNVLVDDDSGRGACFRSIIPLTASGFPYTVLYSGKYILNQRLILFWILVISDWI